MSAYINVFLNLKMDRHLFDIDIFGPSSLYVSHEYINRAKYIASKSAPTKTPGQTPSLR